MEVSVSWTLTSAIDKITIISHIIVTKLININCSVQNYTEIHIKFHHWKWKKISNFDENKQPTFANLCCRKKLLTCVAYVDFELYQVKHHLKLELNEYFAKNYHIQAKHYNHQIPTELYKIQAMHKLQMLLIFCKKHIVIISFCGNLT